MSDYPSSQQLAQAMVEVFRLKRTPAIIMDYDPLRAGYLIVASITEQGVLQRQSLPNKAVVPIQPGMGVLLGRDHKRRLCVVEPDFDQQVAAGINPHVNNPADRQFYGATNQANIQTLFCGALSTDANPSMEVAIHPWMWRGVDGVWHELSEQRFDFTDPVGDGSVGTLVPASAAEHCLVILWVTEENLVTWTASTPININDAISIDDANDAAGDAELTWSPIRMWRLYGGMTQVLETDGWRDARQILNVGVGGGEAGTSDFDYGQMAELIWIG